MTQIIDPKNSLSRVELVVHGQVQGVFFREFVNQFFQSWNKMAGEDKKITGRVANLKKKNEMGVVLEGDEYVLERVLPLFYIGSPEAQLERVEENQWEKITEREFKDFDRSN